MKRRGVARPIWLVFGGCLTALVLGIAGRADDPVPTRHVRPSAPVPVVPAAPAAPRRPVARKPVPPRRFQIAFVREGDVYLIDATGGKARRLTHGASIWNLASEGNRLSGVWDTGAEAAIYSLSAPRWRLTRRSSRGPLFSGLAWVPGADGMVGARSAPSGGDMAWDIWRVGSSGRTPRRLTWGLDADVPADQLLVSPGGTRVATTGIMTNTMFVHVVDVRTGKRIRQPGARGISSGTSLAWLDEDNLLVGASPGEPFWGRGGVRRLDLRTCKLTPWLLSSRAKVERIVRSPIGDRFVIQTQRGAFLVDAATRRQSRLKFTGAPLTVSLDGKQLLSIEIDASDCCCDEVLHGDAYILDLFSGRRRRVARNVTDPVWVERAP